MVPPFAGEIVEGVLFRGDASFLMVCEDVFLLRPVAFLASCHFPSPSVTSSSNIFKIMR